MAGVVLLQTIPRATWREEGIRLGYEDEALEDFITIMLGIDDIFIEASVRQTAADAKKAAEANRHKPRR